MPVNAPQPPPLHTPSNWCGQNTWTSLRMHIKPRIGNSTWTPLKVRFYVHICSRCGGSKVLSMYILREKGAQRVPGHHEASPGWELSIKPDGLCHVGNFWLERSDFSKEGLKRALLLNRSAGTGLNAHRQIDGGSAGSPSGSSVWHGSPCFSLLAHETAFMPTEWLGSDEHMSRFCCLNYAKSHKESPVKTLESNIERPYSSPRS